MKRYNRTDFFLLGMLPVVNALAMLLYGLDVSTSGDYGQGETIPMMLGLVVVSVLFAVFAAVCRGYDIGWPAKMTIPGIIVSIGLLPLVFVLVAYLQFAPGKPEAAQLWEPSTGFTVNKAALGFWLLALPWVLLFGFAEYWNS